MATLDAPDAEWGEALRLVRAAWGAARTSQRGPDCAAARESALAAAREFLAAAASPRLRSLSRLLPPGADERAVLCALVPIERVDARTRVTDADMGISDADSIPAAPATDGAGAYEAPTRPPPALPLVAVADNIRSALNVGGLFRTAAFFGTEGLWLCGYTAGPDHPQVTRAALGADRAVSTRRFDDVRQALREARASGRAVYALETARGAADVGAFRFRFPCALLLGSERFGLDPDVVADADACLAIHGSGLKNSLNVVSAFAVALHAATRTHARLETEARSPRKRRP